VRVWTEAIEAAERRRSAEQELAKIIAAGATAPSQTNDNNKT